MLHGTAFWLCCVFRVLDVRGACCTPGTHLCFSVEESMAVDFLLSALGCAGDCGRAMLQSLGHWFSSGLTDIVTPSKERDYDDSMWNLKNSDPVLLWIPVGLTLHSGSPPVGTPLSCGAV